MAICYLLSVVAILSFATYRRQLSKVVLGLILLIWIAITNSDAYKLRYPGLEAAYYAERVRPLPQIGSPDGESSGDEDGELTQKLLRTRRRIEDLKAVTTTRPRDDEALDALGRAYFEAGELQDQALRVLRDQRRLAASTAQRRQEKANEDRHSSLKNAAKPTAQQWPDEANEDLYQAAIDAFTQSIRFDPNEALAYAGRGAARTGQLRRIAALRPTPPSYKRAAPIAGSNPAGAMSLGDGNSWNTAWSINKIATLEKAIRDDYIMAKELDPGDRNVCLACFKYFDTIGDSKNLISIRLEALRSDRDSLSLLVTCVNSREAMGDLDGAISDIETALQADPGQYWPGQEAELRSSLARLLVRRSLSRANPESSADLSQAFECFLRPNGSVALDPSDQPMSAARAHLRRAFVRAELGDMSGATRDLDQAENDATKAHMTDAQYLSGAQTLRRVLLLQKGQLDEALKTPNRQDHAQRQSTVPGSHADKAIDVTSYVSLARLAAMKGDLGGAVDCLDQAAKLGGPDVRVFALRGAVLARMGDLTAALSDLNNAVQLSNWDGDGHVPYHARRIRARVLLKLGKKDVDLKAFDDDLRAPPQALNRANPMIRTC